MKQGNGINKRLQSLYQFDTSLSKASGRISNLNLLGLRTKFGAAARGSTGAVVGMLADLADRGIIKSGVGIGIDVLAKGAGKITEKSRIPVSLLITNLIKYFNDEND